MEDHDYILFEDYMSNSLSKSEHEAFEKRLRTEASFREAFELYKDTSAFLKHKFSNEQEREALKSNLSKISKTQESNKTTSSKKTKKLHPWKLAIAASLLVIVGVFYSQWFFSTAQYQDFADHPEISLTVRGHNQPLKMEAEKAFNTQNFKEAIPLFKSILNQEPASKEIQIYLAISLIEQDKFAEADAILESLLETPSAYSNQVRWYTALSKLKQENYTEAKTYLEQIPEYAEEFDKAQKVLDKLE